MSRKPRKHRQPPPAAPSAAPEDEILAEGSGPVAAPQDASELAAAVDEIERRVREGRAAADDTITDDGPRKRSGRRKRGDAAEAASDAAEAAGDEPQGTSDDEAQAASDAPQGASDDEAQAASAELSEPTAAVPNGAKRNGRRKRGKVADAGGAPEDAAGGGATLDAIAARWAGGPEDASGVGEDRDEVVEPGAAGRDADETLDAAADGDDDARAADGDRDDARSGDGDGEDALAADRDGDDDDARSADPGGGGDDALAADHNRDDSMDADRDDDDDDDDTAAARDADAGEPVEGEMFAIGAIEPELAGDPDGAVVESDDDSDLGSDLAVALPTSAASMDAAQLKHLVEALVFASDKPLTVARLRQLTRVSDTRRLDQALVGLATDYQERGLVLQQVSGGYQFRTRTQFSSWVQQLIAGRPVRLSRAQLETLAIVAYRQPITRPEIDDIRGVDSSATLKLLIDRQLIRILGKKEEVGRPMLYGTTKEFLDFFSLGDLRELPTLREYSELTDESRRVMSDRLGVDLDSDSSDPDDGEGSGGGGSGSSGGDGPIGPIGGGDVGGGDLGDTSIGASSDAELEAYLADMAASDVPAVSADGDLDASATSIDTRARSADAFDESAASTTFADGDAATNAVDDPRDDELATMTVDDPADAARDTFDATATSEEMLAGSDHAIDTSEDALGAADGAIDAITASEETLGVVDSALDATTASGRTQAAAGALDERTASVDETYPTTSGASARAVATGDVEPESLEKGTMADASSSGGDAVEALRADDAHVVADAIERAADRSAGARDDVETRPLDEATQHAAADDPAADDDAADDDAADGTPEPIAQSVSSGSLVSAPPFLDDATASGVHDDVEAGFVGGSVISGSSVISAAPFVDASAAPPMVDPAAPAMDLEVDDASSVPAAVLDAHAARAQPSGEVDLDHDLAAGRAESDDLTRAVHAAVEMPSTGGAPDLQAVATADEVDADAWTATPENEVQAGRHGVATADEVDVDARASAEPDGEASGWAQGSGPVAEGSGPVVEGAGPSVAGPGLAVAPAGGDEVLVVDGAQVLAVDDGVEEQRASAADARTRPE